MTSKKQAASAALAQDIVQWALDKKAEDLVRIDLRGVFDVTDLFVLATGNSETQVQAIVDHIVDQARASGTKVLHVEGRDAARWVLIDFVDVVVHVMLPEQRMHYGLERLWGDAPLTRYDESGAVVSELPGAASS